LDTQTLAEFGKSRPDVRLDGFRPPNQYDPGIPIATHVIQGGRNRYRRAVIAPCSQ
jgi:hypothetical protein